MTPSSDIQRLNQNIDLLFDKRDAMIKDINTIETDLKVHIGEDTAVQSMNKDRLDDHTKKIDDLMEFKSKHDGEEKGRGWVQKYLPWVISLFLLAEKIFKEVLE